MQFAYTIQLFNATLVWYWRDCFTFRWQWNPALFTFKHST